MGYMSGRHFMEGSSGRGYEVRMREDIRMECSLVSSRSTTLVSPAYSNTVRCIVHSSIRTGMECLVQAQLLTLVVV